MLQGTTNHYTSSASASRFISRLSSITPRNKLLIGSATVLAILFSVSLAQSAATNIDDTFNSQTLELNGPASVNLEDITNGLVPEAAQNESKSETKVEVNASAKVDGNVTSPDVNLSVNGQEIEVPENGHVTETITNDGNTSGIEVNVHSTTSDSENDDRTRIRIKSDTDSEVRIRN